VRLIPLGPTQGQRLQLALAAPLARRAGELIAFDPRSLWSGGVGLGMGPARPRGALLKAVPQLNGLCRARLQTPEFAVQNLQPLGPRPRTNHLEPPPVNPLKTPP